MEKKEIAPKYDPKPIESRWYQFWEQSGFFTPASDSAKEKYVIILPPPNVTGVLHMGHALTTVLEDILIRRKRMQGFNTLWLPGTDHAGIATQMVVERDLLKKEKKSRHELGRDKFLERVWAWKETSQGTILGQLRLIGCSLDWTRLRFTLDEVTSRAVREAFVRLFEEGLIYRDTAIIQWCPRCHTALSDLEVKYKETNGSLWWIRYLMKGDPSRWLTVATTRPETLLGDTAVAVHPDDERYKEFRGKTVLVPLVDREVPVIQDAYVDREFGSGALKITPGHDPNDAVVGARHKLPVISIFDENAVLNREAGPYCGLGRKEARIKVLEDLQSRGFLEKEEPYVHGVGHCDRCDAILEPRMSAQWFVNAGELAKEAVRVVEQGQIQIIPEEWQKTYFEWMNNIRPWCISRQLWWGHRIPIWYCECAHVFASTETPSVCPKCGCRNIRQDEDVLDTWFSSGLWPFSTLGWPDNTGDLKAFYPTSVMETGFDILFFWVARMIMLGLKMTGKIPFHTVYLHPMVRDEYGQKMSKTKGNVKDPLEIIQETGADALRFTLAAMAVHGRDVLLSDSRIQGYRNFINKLWNAARFVMMHFADVTAENIDRNNEINQWIWSRLNQTKQAINEALDQYRFFDAADRLYHFIWSEYCDWFLEFIKVPEELEERKRSKESTAVQILEEVLRLSHPFIPFVTEEIWQQLSVKSQAPSVMLAPYPQADDQNVFCDAERRVGRVIRIVEAVRSKRGEHDVKPGAEIHVTVLGYDAVLSELSAFKGYIQKLVRASDVLFSSDFSLSQDQVRMPLEDVEIRVPRSDLIDVGKERARAQKELELTEAELSRANQKLKSQDFCAKAPENVIAGVRARKEILENKLKALQAYLDELKAS